MSGCSSSASSSTWIAPFEIARQPATPPRFPCCRLQVAERLEHPDVDAAEAAMTAAGIARERACAARLAALWRSGMS